jgi:hypothetical protein
MSNDEKPTPYKCYVIICRPRMDTTGNRWSGWPQALTISLPFLVSSKSEDDLKKMIDAVLEVPEENRVKSTEEWNAYLTSKGVIDG